MAVDILFGAKCDALYDTQKYTVAIAHLSRKFDGLSIKSVRPVSNKDEIVAYILSITSISGKAYTVAIKERNAYE